MSLRAFARSMLAGDRLTLAPNLGLMSSTEQWSESVIYRDGSFQIQLVVLRPNVQVARHCHRRVESLDLALCGSGHLYIGERSQAFGAGMRGSLAANLVPIKRGVWHAGASGPVGGSYLSFQQWDGEPGFISEDWEC